MWKLERISGSIQDAGKCAPWADGVAVLASHCLHDLRNMPQIVNHPGGQQVLQCDGAELGMPAWKRKPVLSDGKLAECVKALAALFRKLVKQRVHALAGDPLPKTEPVKWLEG